MSTVLPLLCLIATCCWLINNCAAFPYDFGFPFYSSSISSESQLNESQPLIKMKLEVLNPIPQIRSALEEAVKEAVNQVLARLPLSSISWAALAGKNKGD